MVSSKDTGRINKRSKKLDLAATIMNNSNAPDANDEVTSTDKVITNIQNELSEAKEEEKLTEAPVIEEKPLIKETPVINKPETAVKEKAVAVKKATKEPEEAPFGLKKDGTPRKKPGRRSENEGEVVRLAVNISEDLYNAMRPALFAHQNNLTVYIKNLIINDLNENGKQYDKIVEMMSPTLKFR